MSYDIYLRRKGKIVQVGNHQEGGIVTAGGHKAAWLNVTYNYSFFFTHFLDKEDGIRWLYGKPGSETIDRLAKAVEILGTCQEDDHWIPTPGNAGHALNVLLGWARQHPDAIWDGD